MELTGTRISIFVLALRSIIGILLIYNGIQKLFGGGMEFFVNEVDSMTMPWSNLCAWGTIIFELAGGLFLVAGLFTRIVALILFVAICICLIRWLDTVPVAEFLKLGTNPLRERKLALVYWIASGLLLWLGAARYSVDHFFQQKKLSSNGQEKI